MLACACKQQQLGIAANRSHRMQTPPSSGDAGNSFRDAILASDQTTRSLYKRTRETRIETRRVLQKPKSGCEFPFHDPRDTLRAALEGAAAVAGTTAPEFELESDPRQVYLWLVKTVIKYGDECREEGRRLERDGSEPRIRKEAALEALTLMSKLNTLLSSPG